MKFNIVEMQIDGYLRKGSLLLTKEDLKIHIPRKKRDHYIGISTITGCGRMLWMNYFHPELIKWPDNSNNDHKSARIFDYGHIVEDIVVQCLLLGGAEITGTQDRYSDFGGVFKGHSDGIINGKLVGEIKSMNEDSFNDWIERGTRKSKWGYYVQTLMYEYYSKTYDGVLISANKNRAIMKCEHIPYDEEVVNFHLEKAKNIAEAKSMWHIEKEFIEQDIDKCTFCPLRKACHGY
ncbi:putative exonuclease protein [Rhizobium phage RHph_TM39]|uniref:Putative exonuclease protein n=1 Tax=Rhizobium phage RHph_Y65 TaxID=2509785 RepID=A0A7S5R8C0_9CAUD|nr:Cas4-domain exonuclease [Rhizobium phage RHph_Y65]QIG71767.1 putative exonuclease protein [Rhizobium phage RHph_TM40]QIG72128.1 putative exonuclease protein [Rhizobium phage RHph_TM2_3B]QIG72490.1 putative exonuclease protein [Rhizobium phage RHph_TM3_3_6]QIG77265.1 putative exonuclease protein [Rhizobium phage RHph_TM39]QIG77880.1 putative exonuclease protein [Rhizobium phage RHph_TM61]